MFEFEVEGYEPFYRNETSILFNENTFEILEKIPDQSVDMIFADPPYFLSNGGVTCQAGKMVSVDKGEWDKEASFNGKHMFNRRWIRMCNRILDNEGTIWISGTLHNIYSVGAALEQEGFQIINNITWQKTNPPPNLACKCFTHSTETVLWARKKGAKYTFNYATMKELNEGKQMKDVWTGPLTPQSEKKYGKHPTQKPEYLLNRIILSSTYDNDIVLDPFCGSGTTGVVCQKLGRNFIGIDRDFEYSQIAKERLDHEKL